MKIVITINSSCLQGSQPDVLNVEKIIYQEKYIDFLLQNDLSEIKKFLSSFSSNCRAFINIEVSKDKVYSMQIPVKYILSIESKE